MKEYQELQSNPIEGIRISSDDPISSWKVELIGPEGSAFEGGKFTLDVVLENYPFKAPKVLFKTKIWHMNIDENGEICQNVYEADWKPTKKIRSIFEVILSILMNPDPNSALRTDIATEFSESFERWFQTAKEWTSKFAY